MVNVPRRRPLQSWPYLYVCVPVNEGTNVFVKRHNSDLASLQKRIVRESIPSENRKNVVHHLCESVLQIKRFWCVIRCTFNPREKFPFIMNFPFIILGEAGAISGPGEAGTPSVPQSRSRPWRSQGTWMLMRCGTVQKTPFDRRIDLSKLRGENYKSNLNGKSWMRCVFRF